MDTVRTRRVSTCSSSLWGYACCSRRPFADAMPRSDSDRYTTVPRVGMYMIEGSEALQCDTPVSERHQNVHAANKVTRFILCGGAVLQHSSQLCVSTGHFQCV